ncbi:MAG: FKBP-type peptidyl-prolyl cis-trans isomerase, partial [Lachnospiraceae bacterium]|nr:FKBP-type peptidyl-prolyl cis-trans isomerase [Lachnospiraceae bacterium]
MEWQTEPTAYLSGINAADYVELPADYAALTVEVEPVTEVTDEDVENKIVELRENRKELQEVSGRTTVEEGDTVNIDYVGRIDGEEFAGGSDSGYDLTIGSGSFIEGFESGLIGHEVGETVTLE